MSFKIIVAATTVAVFTALTQVAPAQRQGAGAVPDVIYYNARVVTVDDQFSYAQAVAIAGDRFSAVGTNEAVRRLAGPNTRQVDLRGMTVVPGLTDNHLHTAGGGPGVDLSRTRTVDEVLNAIAGRVRSAEPGEVVVSNNDWHEAQLKEQRLPLRRDLDRAAPMTPVVILRGGHEYVLNSAALAKWHITRTTPQPAGGRITRYADGELNGELVDTAKSLVTLPADTPRTPEQRIQDQIAEYDKLHAVGLTAVRHPGDSIGNYRMRKEMERRGLLTMRVTQLLRLGGAPAAIEQTLKSSGLSPTDGDALLRLGGMKMGVDGGFEGGYMRDPYEEPYGEGGTFRGLQTTAPAQFNETVKLYNRLGWRVFTHAVGDAAIDEVLAGYEAANAEASIVGKRWGIEHAFIGRRDHLPRMKALGLFLSLQDHLYLAGPSLVKYWGRQRAFLTTPVRMYLDAGLPVSGGTDSSVVPYSPLWVIYHFVTRETISAGPMGVDQKVSREDALRMVTRNHWYLTFEESTKGMIAPGYYADLVVLPEDIMTVPAKRIEQMRVMMTMVGGKVVYRDADFRKVTTE
ncbi:MAG TPA: amidohydrolase [Vicinamibacterales bacterium]|jgi:predicted amidohydrolase YtcJ|nr:amidohydrolase [Vicinamibacterales bacterium]